MEKLHKATEEGLREYAVAHKDKLNDAKEISVENLPEEARNELKTRIERVYSQDGFKKALGEKPLKDFLGAQADITISINAEEEKSGSASSPRNK